MFFIHALTEEDVRAGTVAGVYVGVVYGVERVRGRSDWVRRCFELDSFDCQKNFSTPTSVSVFFCCSRDPLQKNAMVGGALSGALVSAASSNHGDKIVKDAITAGAVATAVEFANYLT